MTPDFTDRTVGLWRRHAPAMGWLPWLLLLGILLTTGASVLAVGWTEDDAVVLPALLSGFVLAALLTQRAIRPGPAAVILLAAGLFLVAYVLAAAWPPLEYWLQGWAPAAGYSWQRMALLGDRMAGWAIAVSGGGSSEDTVSFAFGLGIAAWTLAAILAWSTYRLGKPQIGITLLGIALALNTFYGRAPVYWVVAFVGLAVTVYAVLSYVLQERNWDRTGVDYSGEIRLEMILYAGGISLAIMALAMAIPAINVRAIAEAFQRQEAVIEAEETLSRAFAGVEQPASGAPAGASMLGRNLPRSFLLTVPPQLRQTPILSATAELDFADVAANRLHWRAISYDIYTGDGWQRSAERDEPAPAGVPIRVAPDAYDPGAAAVVTQTIAWADGPRTTRYTLGRPLTFDEDVITIWRGASDLVAARSSEATGAGYEATSVVPSVDGDALAALSMDDVPPEILARYTQLPDTVPMRVHELARQVAGIPIEGDAEPPSAYAQAVAIEQFVRQYPYTLQVTFPPPGVDMVDFFLFDLQRGYCDYYASAMVVMARSVGLPARLAAGFLPAEPDEEGTQTIRQADAHSWAEIYFPGAGWVEFEPTGSSGDEPPPAVAAYEPNLPGGMAGAAADQVSIPDRAPQRDLPILPLLIAAAVLALLWLRWGRAWLRERRSRDPELDPMERAYARAIDASLAAGYLASFASTPGEFGEGFATYLDERYRDTRHVAAASLRPAIRELADLYALHQYGGETGRDDGTAARAHELARILRRGLWRLRFLPAWLSARTEQQGGSSRFRRDSV